MSITPASRRISKALPRGDKFAGQFALPGLVPDMVRDHKGTPILYDNAHDAEFAAMDALLKVYDSRTIDKRAAGGYARMTGAELAVAIDTLNTTPTYIAELVGVPQHRVMKWLDGDQDIPHSVHIAIKLFLMNDANFVLAEEITRQCQEN